MKALLLVLLYFIAFPSWSQPSPKITKKRLAEFRQLTEQRVADLQLYISQIANKELSLALRQLAIENAISLFEKDYFVNGERRSPYVQVSRRNGTIDSVPYRLYFNRLLGLSFDKVEITYYDTAVVSEFEKFTDGTYRATATYFQKFQGFKGGKMVYGSKDRKDISVTGKGMEVYQLLGKEDLKIFFGDIRVVEPIQLIGK